MHVWAIVVGLATGCLIAGMRIEHLKSKIRKLLRQRELSRRALNVVLSTVGCRTCANLVHTRGAGGSGLHEGAFCTLCTAAFDAVKAALTYTEDRP